MSITTQIKNKPKKNGSHPPALITPSAAHAVSGCATIKNYISPKA